MERLFHLQAAGTTWQRELVGGLTTFMTMAYIIFVNPSLVSTTGMPFEAVAIATIFASALATLLMALLANYPFALAPGMGLNAYFAFAVVGAMGVPWQTALGAVFISGVVFVVLTLSRVREMIIDAVPAVLKKAIGAGIGLFIALIGLHNAGIVVANPDTLVALGNLAQPATLLAIIGLALTAVLLGLRIPGAILVGILLTTLIGGFMGVTQAPEGFFRLPDLSAWAPVLGKLDIGAALALGFWEIIFVFLFVDMFDTVGTLIGVSSQGNFLDREGRLPRANRALLSDAIGTVTGSFFGTPTVTTYVESASGVAAGARTGLAGVVVAGAFLLSLFFMPIVAIVPAAATAPALVLVGAMMIRQVEGIRWDDFTDALPAFLTVAAMPFTFSIATGIALGFILYPLLKLATGRGREVHWLTYVLGALFVLRFAFLS
ncbi:permease [Limnochorda pilosa]|uniref:Permease n=1 Tax=Limnochorda pilosa TaxID=1555112 RepID=A0A0K2SJV9_LIMPI|nr:permease [Limnochorda pilosa]